MLRKDRSWDRVALNLALAAGSLLLALGALELVVRGFDLFPEAREVVDQPLIPAGEEEAVLQTVLHPYLGWIVRPGAPIGPAAPVPVNLLGFRSAIDDYRVVPREDYVIGCFGGSVAENLCMKDGDLIAEELERRRPDLAGSVQVLNFAAWSYKQPQQAFALTVALTLGVPLDAVVSLDGFNEVALGGYGARMKYHPLWPSRSALLSTLGFATGELSEEEVLAAAEIVALRRRAASRRVWATEHPVVGRLESAEALIGLLVLRDEAAAERLEAVFQDRAESPAAESLASLPDACLEGSDRRGVAPICWELIADIWARATLAMDAVARRNGVLFLHLLQPNQYVPGSKPLSEEEKTSAISEEQRWADYVRDGYPALRSRIADLARRDVPSVDLTGIFADHPETIYRDTCCHVNREGNRILASRIADLLAARIEPGG